MKFPFVIIRRAEWEWTKGLATNFRAWNNAIRMECPELFVGPHPGNPDAVWRLIRMYQMLLEQSEGAKHE